MTFAFFRWESTIVYYVNRFFQRSLLETGFDYLVLKSIVHVALISQISSRVVSVA